MDTITLIGGHTRPYLENAFRHGRTPAAIDAFNDWDAAGFAHLLGIDGQCTGGRECLERWSLAEGPIIFCSPIECFPEALLNAVAAGRKVFNAPHRAIVACRDLTFLRGVCGDGILLPDTIETSGPARAGWIIKNPRSAGGTGIRPDDGAPRGSEYRQEFITGEAIGAVFYSGGGKTVLAGVTAAANHGFLYGGGVYPAPLTEEGHTAMERFGSRAARDAGLTGWWGADFIASGAGFFLLEINPRFTAGMELIARARGLDLIGGQTAATDDFCHSPRNADTVPSAEQWLGAAADNKSEDVWGNMVVYAKNDVVFKDPKKWFALGARDIPPEGRIIKAGAPALTLYARATSAAECRARLESLCGKFYGEFE